MEVRLIELKINKPTVEQISTAVDNTRLNNDEFALKKAVMGAHLKELGINNPTAAQLDYAAGVKRLNSKDLLGSLNPLNNVDPLNAEDGDLKKIVMGAHLKELGIKEPTPDQLNLVIKDQYLNLGQKDLKRSAMLSRLINELKLLQEVADDVLDDIIVNCLNATSEQLGEGVVNSRFKKLKISLILTTTAVKKHALGNLNAPDKELMEIATEPRFKELDITNPTLPQLKCVLENHSAKGLLQKVMEARLKELKIDKPTHRMIESAVNYKHLNAKGDELRNIVIKEHLAYSRVLNPPTDDQLEAAAMLMTKQYDCDAITELNYMQIYAIAGVSEELVKKELAWAIQYTELRGALRGHIPAIAEIIESKDDYLMLKFVTQKPSIDEIKDRLMDDLGAKKEDGNFFKVATDELPQNINREIGKYFAFTGLTKADKGDLVRVKQLFQHP